MFEAARLADPIAHTSALAGFLAGAVLGIALIAAVAFATFTCGFGVALLAGLAAGMGAGALLGLGEGIGRMFSAPSGALLTGARNVYVNSRLKGSPDTLIGGGRVGYLPVDDEVPAWLRTLAYRVRRT